MSIVKLSVGLDYHQDQVQVCVLDENGKVLMNRSLTNYAKAIHSAVENYGEVTAVAIEACYGAANLARCRVGENRNHSLVFPQHVCHHCTLTRSARICCKWFGRRSNPRLLVFSQALNHLSYRTVYCGAMSPKVAKGREQNRERQSSDLPTKKARRLRDTELLRKRFNFRPSVTNANSASPHYLVIRQIARRVWGSI